MEQIYFLGAIGDTLGLTAILPLLSEKTNNKVNLFTKFPELFFNNPYVNTSNFLNNENTNIKPCLIYSCNIIDYYCHQLKLNYNKELRPELYLTIDEVEKSKLKFKKIENFKKIAVCLYGSNDGKNLRYDNVKDFLLQIKKECNVKLIFFGTESPEDTYNIFDEFVVGEYGKNLRNVFSLINECSLYIGVDTGLFHVAASLNIPQIVFFRNNGCSNNSYINTYSMQSFVNCPEQCYKQHLIECNASKRCMDNFDLAKYTQFVFNEINKSRI
jgi:ADP-heptose:LPS heptosyltransferase